MENCTIYSHSLDFEKVVHIVKSNLPKAKFEYTDEGEQKSIVATIKGGFFGKTKTLKVNYRERKNPSYKLEQEECDLTQNLVGMVNFIHAIPAKNEDIKNKFLHKVMSANCEIPFIAEPQITNEFEAVLRQIVNELDAFIFTSPNQILNQSKGQYFADKNLNLILDTNGDTAIQDLKVQVDSKYHDQPSESYNEEQIARKAESESFLKSHKIKTNKHLPCSPSANDVHLRTIKEVVDRVYALLVISAKGEGVEQDLLTNAVNAKKINSFSPKETYIYQAELLNDQEKAYATWRYESLYTMLWALGKFDKLKYPGEICDVQEVVGMVFHPSRDEFESSVHLRSKTEILDELDKIYRMNWACVDARINGEELTGHINSSVVYERHYSLNWLTNYLDQDWDDVQTNT